MATLNRPKALNALTLDMCVEFDAQLAAWAEDGAVRALLVEGAGELVALEADDEAAAEASPE